MAEMNALNMDELENVTGGKNEKGLEYKPKKIPKGCVLYQIKRGDTMKKIAQDHGITTAELMKLNPNIVNASSIVAGFYLFVPA